MRGRGACRPATPAGIWDAPYILLAESVIVCDFLDSYSRADT
jgi:hypothetical protein